MAATKTDLIMVNKKIKDIIQEISDYASESEEGGAFQQYLEECVTHLSDANFNIDKAIDVINL